MKPGNRVMLKEDYGVYRRGDCGVVLDIKNERSCNIPIMFDKTREGAHNFMKRIEEYRGYWVGEENLVNEKINNISRW